MKKLFAVIALVAFLGGMSAPVLAADQVVIEQTADKDPEKDKKSSDCTSEKKASDSKTAKKASDCTSSKKSSDCTTSKKSSDCSKG